MPELVIHDRTHATACARCATEIAPGLLACPTCARLVHAEDLQRIAWEAEAAQQAGDRGSALVHWRAALALIPAGTRQHETVAARVFELEQALPRPAAGQGGNQGAKAGAVGTLGLILLKFKTAILLILGKAKFLVFGLSKLTTLLSMFLSFGYYWMRFGWAFGAGLVVSIYVHEMGHVWKLRSYGVPSTAPMFIPGFGALIRSQQAGSVEQQTRIGLWGPLWGLAAPVAAAAIYFATGAPVWAVIARWSAMINLFNLLPVWQLDGGHAFESLSRQERWLAAGAVLAAYLVTQEHTLILLMLGCGWQLFRPATGAGDRPALQIYIALVWAFSAFALLVPMAGR